MSIIYDALNKLEKFGVNLNSGPKPKEIKSAKVKIYILYTLIIILGFFVTKTFFSFVLSSSYKLNNDLTAKEITPVSLAKNEIKNEEKPKEVVVVEPQKAPASALTLNGIFFSPPESYALVNNKIIREGDNIEGATLVKITQDSVELKAQDSTIFKLSANIK